MKNLFILCVLVGLLLPVTVSANLLINPTRVIFNSADRSAEITLINTSDNTATYRLQWSEKQIKAGGGVVDLTAEEAANHPVASSMLRFSPRSVTLKPNERQTIKLSLRRPANLADGEYRSHLLFKALPPEKDAVGAAGGQSMAINVVLSFSIPVAVRQGNLQYQLQPGNVDVSYNAATKEPKIRLHFNRSGMHSVVGDISAFWTPAQGGEVLIAKLNEYTAWPELPSNYVDLHWVGSEFALTNGKLRIVYEGSKDFKGQTFIDYSVNINKEAITITK
ncbi:fimbrial biogenesis chaperone [Rheinheimera gaetbuli]